MLSSCYFADSVPLSAEPQARRFLSEQRLCFVGILELLRGEESAVRQTRAAVRELDEAAHLGLERGADGVEQIRQRGVAGSFFRGRTRGAHGGQFFEITFDGMLQRARG